MSCVARCYVCMCCMRRVVCCVICATCNHVFVTRIVLCGICIVPCCRLRVMYMISSMRVAVCVVGDACCLCCSMCVACCASGV